MWIPQLRKIIVSRDVKFNETRFIGDEITDNLTEQKHNPCEPFRVVLEAMNVEQQPPLNEEETDAAQEQEEDGANAHMELTANGEQEEVDQADTTPGDNTHDGSQQEMARADTVIPENRPTTTNVHDYRRTRPAQRFTQN